MITNEEARKAIEKYQKEHPVPFSCNTVDVTAISSKEGADIISQTIERISKQIDDDMELWCICEMAKMYMQGVRPVYPVRPTGEWQRHDEWRGGEYIGGFYHVNCPVEDGYYSNWETNFCPNCGADMRKEADNEQ